MPCLSLKQLLVHYLNLAVCTVYQGEISNFNDFSQDSMTVLLYPLRIGKTTLICHQQIPLKRILRTNLPCYTSAIPRRLHRQMQHPVREITEAMMNVHKVLKNSLSVGLKGDPSVSEASVWGEFSIIDCAQGDIQFQLSAQGLILWLQRLISHQSGVMVLGRDVGNPSICNPPRGLSEDFVWEVCYAYARCCSLQQAIREKGASVNRSLSSNPIGDPTAQTLLTHPALFPLVVALVDILDSLETYRIESGVQASSGWTRGTALLKAVCHAFHDFHAHFASLPQQYDCDRTLYFHLLQATQMLIHSASEAIGLAHLTEEL
jgi:hypothetical protein